MQGQKHGSAIGFIALLLKNLFTPICPNPAGKEKIPAIAKELKRIACEISILFLIIIAVSIMPLLPGSREEENEEHPEESSR